MLLPATVPIPHIPVPAPIPPRFVVPHSANDPEAVAVAETVQHFITAMDSLKLNMAAVDQVGSHRCDWSWPEIIASYSAGTQ